MAGSSRYRVVIRVEGELAPRWSTTLADLAVSPQSNGTTLVSGELPDQAAVHSLLGTIRDLGLSLVSVQTSAIRPSTSGQSASRSGDPS